MKLYSNKESTYNDNNNKILFIIFMINIEKVIIKHEIK